MMLSSRIYVIDFQEYKKKSQSFSLHQTGIVKAYIAHLCFYFKVIHWSQMCQLRHTKDRVDYTGKFLTVLLLLLLKSC